MADTAKVMIQDLTLSPYDDAVEWLRKWDADDIVWSVEMGGLGPGYEQAIQITAAEILRHMIAKQYNADEWDDDEKRKADSDNLDEYGKGNETISKLGLSGAQWGAALNIASCFYRRGPTNALADKKVRDRKIQVCRKFP